MPLWTKTSGWRENIKVGQEVEVRQVASTAYRSKWYRANVIAIRRESDTNPLEIIGGAELEMNGENSTAPLKLLQRKRQVLVVVPQEKLNCLTPPPEQLRNEDGSPLVHPPYTRLVQNCDICTGCVDARIFIYDLPFSTWTGGWIFMARKSVKPTPTSALKNKKVRQHWLLLWTLKEQNLLKWWSHLTTYMALGLFENLFVVYHQLQDQWACTTSEIVATWIRSFSAWTK